MANDFGYDNWVKKAIEYHSDKGDVVIIISSSGESKNMIKACKYASKKKLSLITLTINVKPVFEFNDLLK